MSAMLRNQRRIGSKERAWGWVPARKRAPSLRWALLPVSVFFLPSRALVVVLRPATSRLTSRVPRNHDDWIMFFSSVNMDGMMCCVKFPSFSPSRRCERE